ncbi:uncharacterized protein LOC123519018 isoform X2 [Portunus trituberculatus]|uniref:uncharacterized protein LOC123519018 isoform X2 n=1 Tax=Portunus trituberculatus TaxID=210409 RepID=UPI001E1D0274|nr:uncharacterized protein LOC123519018 isoform X2 [Portunus trituberculatus]
MSQEDCVSSTTDNRLMTVDATKPSQTCNRRYSEVMQEYLKRKRQRDGKIDDDTNIKPSEVLIRQADHTGPDGYSYVRWENLDNLGVLNVNAQVPVMEDCHDEDKYCSPGLSPYSPVTPESGADSFNTAKSHLSKSSSSLPTKTHVSPDARRVHNIIKLQTSVGLDTFRPGDFHAPGGLKAPVINVYSSGGSPKMGHTKDDCGESESRSLTVQPCESASRTYVINDKCKTFGGERTSVPFWEESVQSDASLMREIAQESNEGLLSPITLDFDQDSFSSELCHCYPPEEKGVSTYTLRHTPLQSIGKDGSPTFTSQPSKRQVNNEPMSQATVTARFQKLKRLHRCGWSLIVVGVVIIFIAVLVYFILE